MMKSINFCFFICIQLLLVACSNTVDSNSKIKHKQSPINIYPSYANTEIMSYSNPRTINIEYGSSLENIEVHNKHFTAEDINTVLINNNKYTLQQFHIHSPSEHRLLNTLYPLEIHFVHTDSNGDIAVLAVFVEKSTQTNSSIQDLLNNNTHIYIDELLKTNSDYWHYIGSLTTPPYTEGVKWYISKEPVKASAQQIKELTEKYAETARNIQALNSRKLYLLKP